VHVGCDEVYEPMGFTVDEQSQALVVFDPGEFLGNLSPRDRERLSDICKQGTLSSILELYKFLRNRTANGRRIPVCPGFFKQYSQTLNIPAGDQRWIQQGLNKFQVSRTAFLPGTQRPYIPGSSVKGAIRTAYLNAVAKQTHDVETPTDASQHKRLEALLLRHDFSHIETDPFRMVKVSDFMPVGEAGTRIAYAVNLKKEPTEREAMGPPQILEVIQPGMLFRGAIRVDQPEPNSPITRPLRLPQVWDSIQEFYGARKAEEDAALDRLGINPCQADLSSDGSFLRLGRHSGAECVTIEGHRNVRIIQKGRKSKFANQATTMWLVADEPRPQDTSSLRPMGWIILGRLTAEQSREYELKEKEWLTLPRPATTDKPEPSLDDLFQASTKATPQQTEVWEGATLEWTAGSSTLTAKWQGKKATCKGLDTTPEGLRDRLKKKKKTTAQITVQIEGKDYLKIVKVDAKQ